MTITADPATGRQVVWRDCPLCGTDNRPAPHVSFAPPEWPLKTCTACGLLYLEKVPVYEEQAESHAWEKSAVETHEARKEKHPLMVWFSKVTRWRLHLFRRSNIADRVARLLPAGVVLDLGCGSGNHLETLPTCYTPYGVEISNGLAQMARERFAGRDAVIVTGPSLEGLKELPENSVDCAVLRSYLEHETQPGPVLTELARVLKPGGFIVLKVPNFASLNRVFMGKKWCGFRFPDHVNYFDFNSLTNMLGRHGFSDFSSRFMDRLPFNDNIWVVARCNKNST